MLKLYYFDITIQNIFRTAQKLRTSQQKIKTISFSYNLYNLFIKVLI